MSRTQALCDEIYEDVKTVHNIHEQFFVPKGFQDVSYNKDFITVTYPVELTFVSIGFTIRTTNRVPISIAKSITH